jgi:hypothetical protein|tara:strand:+ start:37 stop:747 length:711 start_codon:yes stop_codon:yes gene_type:complete
METEIVAKRSEEALQGLTLIEARAFIVTDGETKKTAAARRDIAILARKTITDFLDPHVDRARKAWQGLTTERKKAVEVPVLIEEAYKKAIQVFDIADSQRRQEEDLASQATERKTEEARRVGVASELDREGRYEEAEALLDAPIIPISAQVPPPDEDVQSYRDQWSAVIVDLPALVQGVADGTVSLPGILGIEQAKQPGVYTSKFWNQQARSLKSMLRAPGIRVENNPVAVAKMRA